MKNWKKLALKGVRQLNGSRMLTSIGLLAMIHSSVLVRHCGGIFIIIPVDGENSGMRPFNEDVLCAKHKCLTYHDLDRRVISDDAWGRLKRYFPNAPELSVQNSEPCNLCQVRIPVVIYCKVTVYFKGLDRCWKC